MRPVPQPPLDRPRRRVRGVGPGVSATGRHGDPPELVVRDVLWHKVSPRAAEEEYAVVLTGSVDDDTLAHDPEATAGLRAERAAARPQRAFFDRGPGYRQLSGDDAAEVDWT